jgi:hypothetical protein
LEAGGRGKLALVCVRRLLGLGSHGGKYSDSDQKADAKQYGEVDHTPARVQSMEFASTNMGNTTLSLVIRMPSRECEV